MRGRLHLAETHDVFANWYADRDTSSTGLHFKKHVDDFKIILTKAQYCCACGKRMQVGDKAHQSLVTWGERVSESALRPHHMEPCIPAFEFQITLIDENTYTFSNFALNKEWDWVATIGEPLDIRTRKDADEWIEWAGRYFDDNIIKWQSYTIKQDGIVVREEKKPVEEKINA